METEDPAMRERLVGLKLQRDQTAKEIGELQNRMASSTPTITPEKVARVGALLRDKLYQGPPEFRQAYARLLMEEVRVTDDEIRISGSKSVLARCAAEGEAEPAPRVLSFVQEWRARQDSNLWPLPSERAGTRTVAIVGSLGRSRSKKGLAFGSKESMSVDVREWRAAAEEHSAPIGGTHW